MTKIILIATKAINNSMQILLKPDYVVGVTTEIQKKRSLN